MYRAFLSSGPYCCAPQCSGALRNCCRCSVGQTSAERSVGRLQASTASTIVEHPLAKEHDGQSAHAAAAPGWCGFSRRPAQPKLKQPTCRQRLLQRVLRSSDRSLERSPQTCSRTGPICVPGRQPHGLTRLRSSKLRCVRNTLSGVRRKSARVAADCGMQLYSLPANHDNASAQQQSTSTPPAASAGAPTSCGCDTASGMTVQHTAQYTTSLTMAVYWLAVKISTSTQMFPSKSLCHSTMSRDRQQQGCCVRQRAAGCKSKAH
jgi:hypothetical protein